METLGNFYSIDVLAVIQHSVDAELRNWHKSNTLGIKPKFHAHHQENKQLKASYLQIPPQVYKEEINISPQGEELYPDLVFWPVFPCI